MKVIGLPPQVCVEKQFLNKVTSAIYSEVKSEIYFAAQVSSPCAQSDFNSDYFAQPGANSGFSNAQRCEVVISPLNCRSVNGPGPQFATSATGPEI